MFDSIIWILVFLVQVNGSWDNYNSLLDDGVYWETYGLCMEEVKRIYKFNPELKIKDVECKMKSGMVVSDEKNQELFVSVL